MCNLGESIARKNKAEGENRFGKLMDKLFSLNRIEDAKRCATDVEYREKLYKEFQLA